MQRDDRSTELRGPQVTDRPTCPCRIRRKPAPAADIQRPTLVRPSPHPRTPSPHPRRRRTLMLPRQGPDRPGTAGRHSAGGRTALRNRAGNAFRSADPEAMAVDEPCDCSHATRQCLPPRRRHCFGRIRRKQCGQPLKTLHAGLPASHAGGPRQTPGDARGHAPGGPQAAPVGPCRVLRRRRGHWLEGRPPGGPAASGGRPVAASDSAAARRRRGDQEHGQGQHRPAQPLALGGPAPGHARGRSNFAFPIKCEVLGQAAQKAAT